ncbi:MAG: response regulator transcription factor [Oscillospiraceae bacterium]|nr:response regulator transcription factor [Oscillospiraceae bacterium]
MIYFIEDDKSINEAVFYSLKNSGFDVKGFDRPSEFWSAMKEQLPSLILLDIMLPEEDGLSILRKIRKNSDTLNIPVIMVTAKDAEYDKVIGLDSGADDYMTKPFSMLELVSRIRALLRRTSKPKEPDVITIGNLSVNPEKHIVTANGKNVVLTYKEYHLLLLLMQNKGVVFSREKLLNKIWGYEFDGENRTVDVHIRSLRTKLGECGNMIETIRGFGYKIGE